MPHRNQISHVLVITFCSELRFWWSSTLWKAYVNLYKDIEKSMSLDQFLGTNLMHQFNRCYYFMWNFNQFSISVSSFFDSCFARALYSSLGPNIIHLTNLLVPLIMLSHNHQNHKQWPNGAMFLTISPFLVIDDNTIKVSINFARIDNLNYLHLLGCLLPFNLGMASP